MSAAYKVALVYARNRTSLGTSATAGALIVIDPCKVIDHLDRSLRAGLFALAAGNTSVLTELSYVSTLIVAVTFNNNSRRVLYNMNNTSI